jgi:hypothetical protein
MIGVHASGLGGGHELRIRQMLAKAADGYFVNLYPRNIVYFL